MIFELATALLSEFKDKALLIAVDLLGSDERQSGAGLPSVQPLGLLARPLDPTDKGAAGVLFSWDGHEGFALPTTDPRALPLMPPVDKGGTVLHGTGAKVAFVYLRPDGGLMILCASSVEGQNHAISVDPGTDSIQIRHAKGMGLTMTGGGKNSIVISNKAADSYIEVNDAGITLNGNVTMNGGAAMGPGSLPVALSTEVTALAAYVAGLKAPPGTAGGPLVGTGLTPPAPSPGSTKLSAAP